MAKRARGKIGRREWLARIGAPGLTALVLAPRHGARAMSQALAATAAADGVQLLVAGPASGGLAQWANLLCPLIGPAMGVGAALNWNPVGAADGVTAANQFDAQVSPDGNTAMLLPGAAAIAQLVGDPRARFDAGAWVAGMAGMSSTIVMGRAPLAELPAGNPLRVLANDPTGGDLPALLGLSLLGYTVKPVSPAAITGDARTALMQGQIDIATLSQSAVGTLAAWQQSGLAALFSLGAIDATGAIGPDPAFPRLPALDSLLRAKGVDSAKPLPTALKSLVVAKQMTLGLVLPQLTPASRVAQWRQACAESIASLTIQAVAAAESLRLTTQPTAAAVIAAITAPAGAQLELHQWLANGLGWRPG